jgi:hypothetical protein
MAFTPRERSPSELYVSALGFGADEVVGRFT